MQAPNISLCSDRCKTDYAGVEQPGGTLRFSAVFSRCRGDAANLVLLLGFFGTRARRAGSPHDISITRQVRLHSQSILAPQGSHYSTSRSRPTTPARARHSSSL